MAKEASQNTFKSHFLMEMLAKWPEIKKHTLPEEYELTLTINGTPVDVMSFINFLEEQFNREVALKAKEEVSRRADDMLDKMYELRETLIHKVEELFPECIDSE